LRFVVCGVWFVSWGLWFGVWGLGFGVSKLRILGSGFRVQGVFNRLAAVEAKHAEDMVHLGRRRKFDSRELHSNGYQSATSHNTPQKYPVFPSNIPIFSGLLSGIHQEFIGKTQRVGACLCGNVCRGSQQLVRSRVRFSGGERRGIGCVARTGVGEMGTDGCWGNRNQVVSGRGSCPVCWRGYDSKGAHELEVG